MSRTRREVREIVREEPWRRRQILALLASGPKTVPEIAAGLGVPADEVVCWVMGLRRYGWIAEYGEPTEHDLYRYQAVSGRAGR